MAITHYTELLESKGLVLARADSISQHLISPAEVHSFILLTLTDDRILHEGSIGDVPAIVTSSKGLRVEEACYSGYWTETVCMQQARTLMTLTYAFYTDPVSFLHVHNCGIQLHGDGQRAWHWQGLSKKICDATCSQGQHPTSR